MEDCGITVTERVPLKVGHTRHNAHYLATKAKKSGHLL
jgi:GTP cyclohydrolase II